MESSVPMGITLLFAGILVALIVSLALEEKLHAKKSLIVGLYATVALLLGAVLLPLPYSPYLIGGHEMNMPVYIPAIDWGVITNIFGASLFVDCTSPAGRFSRVRYRRTTAPACTDLPNVRRITYPRFRGVRIMGLMTAQSTNDLSIMIGGDAGQGVESSGAGFALALARAGLHVFALQDYRSRIRGGHNFYQIRVGERPLYSDRRRHRRPGQDRGRSRPLRRLLHGRSGRPLPLRLQHALVGSRRTPAGANLDPPAR